MILEKIPRDEEKESSSTSRNLVFFVVIFLAAGGLSFLLLEIFLAPEPKKTHYLLGARDSFLRKPACRWGSLGRRERILISSTTNQPPYVFIWYKIWSGGWWKGKRPLPHCHQTPLGKGIELWCGRLGGKKGYLPSSLHPPHDIYCFIVGGGWKMERDTILLSWNLGPKVNSRNRPKFLRETRLVAY